MHNATKFDIMLIAVYIAICTIVVIIAINTTIKKLQPKPIQVYYEYDVYNTAIDGNIVSDTIPCDTTFLVH